MGELKVSLSIGGSQYTSTGRGGNAFSIPNASSGESDPTVVKVALPIDDSYTTGAIVDVIAAVGSAVSAMVVTTRESVAEDVRAES
jgi:hypothetical protein